MSYHITGYEREPRAAFAPIQFEELFDMEVADAVKGILNGSIRVEGFSDHLLLAEMFVQEVEGKWTGENTAPHWDAIAEEREQFLTLAGVPF